MLTFAQEETSTTLFRCGFHLKKVLGWFGIAPYSSIQISVLNEELREITFDVIVCDIGGLGALPRLHFSVVFMYSYVFANSTFPVPSLWITLAEIWECGIQAF